ncbi:N-sulfoglucosamine sulfohydrolase [Roseimicrobium gellanilyticum]|uniref:N-sulfoglucosamine sulfohydrolase n=1 Tax=Roseimicrobium gellanilyticum TaxID=748857 RepID=A0A366HRV5_9BACT|nr:sulfatase [Roseimicrobium gellanilyticum]RBP45633.1 N-sulfoglucosamine sulfohydrolase [Roseimicrobium gellanilyticum]
MKRTFLLLLVFISAWLSASAAENPKVNVLLITSDDLGVQVGCYGDKVARTPNLDAMAKKGRLFENAYVAQASCSPSRSAMFTGIYPHANGQYGLVNGGFALHEPLRAQTIPALLKNAGYSTALLGKLHVAPENTFPFDQRLKSDMRDVKNVAKVAGAYIRETQEPFFFMVNFADPHVMGRSPRPPDEAFPTQYEGIPETPLKVGEVPPFPFQKIDTQEQIERVTQYYNAVTRIDAGLGLLLAELEASGKMNNTLVLFVGDHGPPFVRGKTSCYEGGVKVPMLALWPGVFTPGERTPALVGTVDLLPTILDATGQTIPGNVQGRSLRHTLDASQHRQYLATEFHFHGSIPFFPRRTIRDARYKLIHNLLAGKARPNSGIDGDAALAMARSEKFSGTEVAKLFELAANPPEFELYDLQTDPWEWKDLASQPEHAETLKRLQTALLEWRENTKDPLLTPEGMAAMKAMEKPMTHLNTPAKKPGAKGKGKTAPKKDADE